MKRPLLLAAALAMSAGVLCSCSADRASTPHTPAKSLERWALPLDQYADQNSALREYAENLMVARCLAKQGIEWPVPWRPLDAPALSPSYTAGGARLFDEKIAAGYGYHRIPIVYEGREQQRKAFDEINAMVDRDPSIGEKSDACLSEARKTIPSGVDGGLQLRDRLGVRHRGRESATVGGDGSRR